MSAQNKGKEYEEQGQHSSSSSDKQNHIKRLVDRHNDIIQTLIHQSHQIQSLIHQLTLSLKSVKANAHPSPTPHLFDLSEHASAPYHLSLESPLPQPILKGRSFDLHLILLNSNQECVVDHLPFKVRMQVYSAEAPYAQIQGSEGQMMVYSRESERVCEGKGIIKNVRMKQVTSHFKSGWVQLVIRCDEKEENPQIAPLVLKKVIVKKDST